VALASAGGGGVGVVFERTAPDTASPGSHHQPEDRQQPDDRDEEADHQRAAGRGDLEPDDREGQADELDERQHDEGDRERPPQQVTT
jgi:hypothetical protein